MREGFPEIQYEPTVDQTGDSKEQVKTDELEERRKKDKIYAGRYWERKRDARLNVLSFKEELKDYVNKMCQQKSELVVDTRLNQPISEETKEYMSALRLLAEELGYKIGNFYFDEDDLVLKARVEKPFELKTSISSIGQPAVEIKYEKGYFNKNTAESLDLLKDFSQQEFPENKECYEHSLDKALEILKQEKGIVELDPNIPTYVVSDIHARRDFLIKLLETKIRSQQNKTIFELLQEGKANIVCVGDGMHSEKTKCWNDFESGRIAREANELFTEKFEKVFPGKSLDELLEMWNHSNDPEVIKMREVLAQAEKNWEEKIIKKEMARSLGTMKMVMDLKTRFPKNFHFLRGNHDDINSRIYGDCTKGGVNQSEITKSWLQNNFGDAFVSQWAEFEDNLPLIVKGKNFLVSHAAPGKPLSMDEINQRTLEATFNLTWTENRPKPTNDPNEIIKIHSNIQQILDNLGMPPNSIWIIGHRPVDSPEKFRSQFGGQLIQINDENRFLVAGIHSDKTFIPNENIRDLKE